MRFDPQASAKLPGSLSRPRRRRRADLDRGPRGRSDLGIVHFRSHLRRPDVHVPRGHLSRSHRERLRLDAVAEWRDSGVRKLCLAARYYR